MAVLVTRNSVLLERVLKCVTNQLSLPVVEKGKRPHVRLQLALLMHLAVDVCMQLLDGPTDDLNLRD